MSRVRCPQKLCSFWLDDWCDADEIEIDLKTLSCMTFDEIEEVATVAVSRDSDDDDEEIEWEWMDAESLFEDDMDESLYGVDDGDPELEDDEDDILEEENPWPP